MFVGLNYKLANNPEHKHVDAIVLTEAQSFEKPLTI